MPGFILLLAMALRNQPYIPLYVNDFMSDEKLAECSASATGIYIRIMCLMHKSEHYGKILLKQNDKLTIKQEENFAIKLARHLPYDRDVILPALLELLDNNVLTIDGDILLQKRMVKDGELSSLRSDIGREGGKKTQQKNRKFAKANNKANNKANSEIENINENEISIIPIDIDIGKSTLRTKGPQVSRWVKIEKFADELKASDIYSKVITYLSITEKEAGKWLDMFVKYKAASTDPNGMFNDLVEHFKNWTYQKLPTQNQRKNGDQISTGTAGLPKDYDSIPEEYRSIAKPQGI